MSSSAESSEQFTKLSNLHFNNSDSEGKILNSFEGLAINDKGSFDRLRDTLKKTGDMFLFGKPTPDLINIMLKIYNENVIRNLCFLNNECILDSVKRDKRISLQKANHVNAMCGMIQMDDGQIYITVSESPNFETHVEDVNFIKKEEALINILSACNITTNFPEDNEQNVKIHQVIINLKKEMLKEDNDSTWRRYQGNFLTPLSAILNPEKKAVYQEHLLLETPEETNYDTMLWKKTYGVNIINSYKYLKKRLNEGKSFAPFKKYNVKKERIECNNGSTCTESKLFSYVYNDLHQTFENIKGFAVFWIGNDLPPKHIIKGYCYDVSKEDERLKVDAMVNEILRIYNVAENEMNLFKKYERLHNTELFKDIVTKMMSSAAMACPGCYSNAIHYKTGNMDTVWDQKGCYTNIKSKNARTKRKHARNARARNRELARQALNSVKLTSARLFGGTRKRNITRRKRNL